MDKNNVQRYSLPLQSIFLWHTDGNFSNVWRQKVPTEFLHHHFSGIILTLTYSRPTPAPLIILRARKGVRTSNMNQKRAQMDPLPPHSHLRWNTRGIMNTYGDKECPRIFYTTISADFLSWRTAPPARPVAPFLLNGARKKFWWTKSMSKQIPSPRNPICETYTCYAKCTNSTHRLFEAPFKHHFDVDIQAPALTMPFLK